MTCLTAGRSVVVTITDRGPWTGGRVIDMSEAAAEGLGFRRRISPTSQASVSAAAA